MVTVSDWRTGEVICAVGGKTLQGARLAKRVLDHADLKHATLCGAELRGASLTDGNLYGADLRDADLRDANLRDADLRLADLRGAQLDGVNLDGAWIDSSERWPEGFDPAEHGAILKAQHIMPRVVGLTDWIDPDQWHRVGAAAASDASLPAK